MSGYVPDQTYLPLLVMVRSLSLLVILALFTVPYSALAQLPEKDAYATERNVIEAIVGTLVNVIEEATVGQEGDAISSQLRDMARQLNGAALPFAADDPTPVASTAAPLASDDLRQLTAILSDLHRDVEQLRAELDGEASDEAADRLAPVESQLEEAIVLVARLSAQQARSGMTAQADGEASAWLQPGRYDEQGNRSPATSEDEAYFDDESNEGETGRERRTRWREGAQVRDRLPTIGLVDYADRGAYFGAYPSRWPYAETAIYRTIPAIRYNRVEGLVLGIASAPLEWHDLDRARIVGQVGYAFALDRLRYEAGLEAFVFRSPDHAFSLKAGGVYRYNTATNDLWKSNWVENTLAAFFFRNDFFDYHGVEGWSAYAVQRITPLFQLTGGVRAEEHRSLARNASWALFGGESFRENPLADEGRMHSVLIALEGGRVVDLNYLPRGAAFRTELEIGSGLGGDFDFNRFVADGRLYVPTTPFSSLGLRLRGGIIEGDEVPFQKAFTLGGIGSVRGYPLNTFFGTRMLLGNVEFAVEGLNVFDDIFEEMQVLAFADAGWVSTPYDKAFDMDTVFPSAGVGLALDERNLRLELAWPLRDFGTGLEPMLWLRLAPTF